MQCIFRICMQDDRKLATLHVQQGTCNWWQGTIEGAFGNIRKVVPVHITSGLCSASCPYNSAGSAVLQCRQQQACQVCMPEKVCPNLALQRNTIAVKHL